MLYFTHALIFYMMNYNLLFIIFAVSLRRKITIYLLKINQHKEWVDRFAPFGLTGFTTNFEQLYKQPDGVKSVVTSVPYY